MSGVINFDPNVNYSGNTCKKTVRLTFGCWDYRLVVEQIVGGNTAGLNVIDYACELYAEQTAETGIIMKNAAGDTCLFEDDDDRYEEWLHPYLIGAEIIALEPVPYKPRLPASPNQEPSQ